MNRTFRREVTAVCSGLFAATALLALSACSGEPSEVSGHRDDVKSYPAITEQSHYVVKPKTTTVCVSRDKKGRCTSSATRPDGTKREKVIDRPGKPAVYCVELDDVNGKPTKDDQWYEVTSATYFKALSKDEGDKMKFSYLGHGCWR